MSATIWDLVHPNADRFDLRTLLPSHLRAEGSGERLQLSQDACQATLSWIPAPSLPAPLVRLPPADAERFRAARWAIQAELRWEGAPSLLDFSQSAMLILPWCRGAVAVLDRDTGRIRPTPWFEALAHNPVGPKPLALAALHAVGGEDTEGIHWVHSHGLRRFDRPDVEVHQVRAADLPLMGSYLNAVVERVMLEGPPPAGALVSWGSGAEAALVPIHALAEDPYAAERGSDHPTDNLALVVPDGQGGFQSAVHALRRLPPHPIFYRSKSQTERDEALARLRWPVLVAAWPRLRSDARLLAKVGYGGEQGEGITEHLWFEVHDVEPEGLVGTLLNQPHQDLGLRQGDRGRHPLSRLSDFRIQWRQTSVDPDDLPLLLHQVGRA